MPYNYQNKAHVLNLYKYSLCMQMSLKDMRNYQCMGTSKVYWYTQLLGHNR